jgi:inner membrane transporter RhtA
MTLTDLKPTQVLGRTRSNRAAPLWVISGMFSAQLGAAAATPLFKQLGPLGTGWLRLCWAGFLFACIVRPRFWRMPRHDLAMTAVLGCVNAIMMLSFFQAIDRLPLGTAGALAFLGPLSIAVFKARSRLGLLWPALALLGVLALTRPWSGTVNGVGIAFALSDGLCWALYILLTEHLGARFKGSEGLAMSMIVAALVATVIGAPHAIGHLTVGVVFIAAAIALLSPIFTFSMELAALRRLSAGTFGTFMCLEPAIALLVGLVFLRQVPSLLQGLGVFLVVVAAFGAVQHGRAGSSGLATVHSS